MKCACGCPAITSSEASFSLARHLLFPLAERAANPAMRGLCYSVAKPASIELAFETFNVHSSVDAYFDSVSEC